ncbi:MAG: hypothetical protein M1834_000139 [Cirrosporium novae-zelandiae]|nr:MAG: hypothetical protein M1834_000139 [Cirrosporium novae-zelandiae]
MDSPAAEEGALSPQPPNVLWTPEIEEEINTWKSAGKSPFPQLSSFFSIPAHEYTIIDLRLIHHITNLSIQMHHQGFLKIAATNNFVMSSLLALSATHLAWLTGSPETDNLAYHYRGVALKGLQTAIGNFSKENSDAILAASLLLSWQANDWRGWVSLMQGISTVINTMQPWKAESELAECMDEQAFYRGIHPLTPTSPESMAELQSNALSALDRIQGTMHSVQHHFPMNENQMSQMASLYDFMQRLRNVLPSQSPERAFEMLQPLRSWLFWLPPSLLTTPEMDIGPLAAIANFFAMSLALDPLLPQGLGAYIASIAASPVEEIYRIFHSNLTANPSRADYQMAARLTEYPYEILTQFWSRASWNSSEKVENWAAGPSFFDIGSPLTDPKAVSDAFATDLDRLLMGQNTRNLSVPLSPYHTTSEMSSPPLSLYSNHSPQMHPSIPASSMATGSDLRDSPGTYSPASFEGDPNMMYQSPSMSYTGGFVAPIPWA